MEIIARLMMRRGIAALFLFAIAGVIHIARVDVPDDAAVGATGQAKPTEFYSKPNPWSSDKVIAARHVGSWRGEVHLDRNSDGHFYTTAEIGGARIQAVVDTGASIIALPGADARKAGLTWDPDEVRPVGRGASGTVRGVIRTLPRIDVGGIVAENVTVMIIPNGLDIALLGQNFLSRVRKVEIRGGQMVLSNI